MVQRIYSCVIEGALEGMINGSKSIECFPGTGLPSDLPEGSGFYQVGSMRIGLFSSVTLMRYAYPIQNNLLPISDKKHCLMYWIIGRKDSLCEKAKSKLEKLFGIELNEDEM